MSVYVEPSPEKLMLEADLYQQINMMEVAIDKLQEALKLEPNDPIIRTLHWLKCYIMMVNIYVLPLNTKPF